VSDTSRIGAVTFDFWNTLVAEGGAARYNDRAGRWTDIVISSGHDVTQEVMERAMTDLWTWFNARWEDNLVVSPAMLVAHTLELLGVDHDPALARRMEDTLHQGVDPEFMVTAPGIADALERLRSAGLRVGIICDVGMTPSAALRRYLDHHGLLEHFDGWSFSDEVGCYKPDPRIFAHARESLGLDPSVPMAHIGDLRRTDVAGARGAGWRSIRYTGFYDDDSELVDADVVIASHSELSGALGIE
jgi:putative hydrolase of the HAD superfamily